MQYYFRREYQYKILGRDRTMAERNTREKWRPMPTHQSCSCHWAAQLTAKDIESLQLYVVFMQMQCGQHQRTHRNGDPFYRLGAGRLPCRCTDRTLPTHHREPVELPHKAHALKPRLMGTGWEVFKTDHL